MERVNLEDVFGTRKPVIGMVHLRPMPGSPGYGTGTGALRAVAEAAVADARALADGGVDGIMIENFGDAPFFPDHVPPVTVACMTAVAVAVRGAVALPLGINVLRNDAGAALAVALACDGRFIRVNVHTGAMLTDQGWIGGRAHETVRLRASLHAPVAILADVMVKHAVPPAGMEIADAAQDTWHRGAADGLIVSGRATGAGTPLDRLRQVRSAVPAAPLFAGSGVDEDTAAATLDVADGIIIGSALQHGGRAGNPVDPARVRRFMNAIGR